MADIPFEHAPEEVEVLPIEAAELSAPATLIEEPGTLLETAGETEEVINRIEHTKKNGKTIERKREAHTAEEHTNGKGAELSGAEETIQPAKKPTSRKRTKPIESTSPAAEPSETAEPKQPTTRRRKKSVELAISANEAEDVSEPKKPMARKPEAASAEMPAITEAALIEAVSEEARVVIIDTARAGADELIAPVAVIEEVPFTESATLSAPITERRQLVKSAALVSIGNLGSSLMGMARQIVVASLGPSIGGPFNAALAPANNFFQLLINGSVSGALVPTFNDYAAPEKRQEMRRVVFTVVNLIFLLALVASVGYVLIAPWFINVLVQGYSHQSDKLLTLQYSQIIFFSLAALGPFAVLLSALFALKEFGWPAFATAAYHVGIILGAIGLGLFGSSYLGRMALPAGVLLGALGEIALLLPGIRNQHFYYMFVLDLKHPALRRIIKLYFPILISYIFTTALVFLDVNLWARAGGDGTANTLAQATATALLQFPVGLVAMALGFAVLPTLSEHAREGNSERFKTTLLLGFRVGLLLMIPAMVGMWVLRLPIVYLLFAHHNNNLANAGLSALALQNYVYQLPFVAVDQLLIAAFYARKNTMTPVVVGIVCIGFYLAVALPFFQTIGIAALAFANTVQNSMHAIILLFLLRKAMGSLHIRTSLPTILKICLASALMGLVAWGALALLSHVALFSLNHLLGQFLTLIVAGGLASVVYFGAIMLFKVEEISLLKGAILAKLGRR